MRIARAFWTKCGHPRTRENTTGVSARQPGGQCRLCRRAAQARYDASDAGRAAQARYYASDKGRAVRARYAATDKGRAAQARYAATDKGRAAQARYYASDKGCERSWRYAWSVKGMLTRGARELAVLEQRMHELERVLGLEGYLDAYDA